jgi:hypothetical protein
MVRVSLFLRLVTPDKGKVEEKRSMLLLLCFIKRDGMMRNQTISAILRPDIDVGCLEVTTVLDGLGKL